MPVVLGHQCSGAAIPASEVYEEAGILFISPAATNPALTERGLRTVFRVVGRDDQQGTIAGDYLADAWGDGEIAIVHDSRTYGEGLAEEVRRRLRERGLSETLYEAVTPGQTEFSDLIARLEGAGIDVVFFGGYPAEGGLLTRQVRERLGDVQLVVPDGVVGEDFGLIAGSAADGTLMTLYPDARQNPEAAPVVARFRADGYEPLGSTMNAYAAVQTWARAVEEAGAVEPAAVAEALRSHTFNTVLGRIGFDDRGDVTGYEPFVWYEWTNGEYVPLEDVPSGN